MTGDSDFRSSVLGDGLAPTRQTAHEYVRGVMRRAILNGELASGSRLVQAELASMLDVSTTPVREALRDLATEGLVRFDPHHGAVVAELSSDDVHEIYEIRSVLEPLAIRQAVPKLSDQLLARLKELHQKMLAEPQSAEWVDRNRTFHMAIYEAAASPRLVGIISNLQDASLMYIGASLKQSSTLRDDANRDHAEILDALEQRDAEAAVEVLTRHLATSIHAFEDSERARS